MVSYSFQPPEEKLSPFKNLNPGSSTYARGQSGNEQKDSCASTRLFFFFPLHYVNVWDRGGRGREEGLWNVREAANILSEPTHNDPEECLVLSPTLFSLRLLLFLGTSSHFMTRACLWLGLRCSFWSNLNKLETKACEVVICNSCRTWVAAQKKGSVDERKCLFYFI